MAKKKEVEKASQNVEDANKNGKDENLEEEEPDFSDPEGFVDSLSDEGT